MTSIITAVRDIIPIRPLTFVEALRIAELQATKLLELSDLTEPPFPDTIISELPKLQVERIIPAPASGATQWSRGRWLILLNGAERPARQRFSLAHEFKHVLDNPFIDVLYPASGDVSPAERAEQICDYFAACLLMPRMWVKRSWTSGTQEPRTLARQFDVSKQAMKVRLLQIGLIDPEARCLTVGVA
jgi:Zn-dependent peptidase ImmA (M78 family)